MTRFLKHSVLAVAAGAVLSGCSTTEKLTKLEPDLVQNKTWVLIAMDGKSVAGDSRVTIEFRPSLPDQGRISGRAQCNNYFGGYRIADGKITFSSLGSTRMACPMPLMDLEKQYLQSFPNMNDIESGGNELTLLDKQSESKLTYAAETGVIRGEIIPASGRFPAGSEIIIRLQDSNTGDRPEGVIGEERIRLGRDIDEGFSYSVNYAPQLVKPGRDYELAVQVLQRGRLLYTTRMKPVVHP